MNQAQCANDVESTSGRRRNPVGPSTTNFRRHADVDNETSIRRLNFDVVKTLKSRQNFTRKIMTSVYRQILNVQLTLLFRRRYNVENKL